MSEQQPRQPFDALRAWAPARDERARATARAGLDAQIAAARTQNGSAHASRPRGLALRERLLRRRWLAASLAVLAIGGSGGALAAVLLRTEHTVHLPVFTAAGRLSPQFHVGARGSGHCWTSSLASHAANAYRCIDGNAIHDPCFAASPRAHTVYCFLDPWHAVTALRLRRKLPAREASGGGPPLPWAIVTADGRRCVFLTGATAPMGGRRVDYGCVGGSYLLGAPDRAAPLWTIRSSRSYRPEPPGHARPIIDFPLVAIRQTIE